MIAFINSLVAGAGVALLAGHRLGADQTDMGDVAGRGRSRER